MPSIYQRKSDGRWVASISVGPRGARRVVTRYAATQEEAERLVDDLQRDPDVHPFWRRVDRSGGPDACWPWMRVPSTGGYGLAKYKGRRRIASRVAWELTNGPIPGGMQVLHHCDNPPCCNPAHLFLGTVADNVADMIAKGRAAHQRDTGAVSVTTSDL